MKVLIEYTENATLHDNIVNFKLGLFQDQSKCMSFSIFPQYFQWFERELQSQRFLLVELFYVKH